MTKLPPSFPTLPHPTLTEVADQLHEARDNLLAFDALIDIMLDCSSGNNAQLNLLRSRDLTSLLEALKSAVERPLNSAIESLDSMKTVTALRPTK